MHFQKIIGLITVFVLVFLMGWNKLFISERTVAVSTFTSLSCTGPVNVFIQEAEEASVIIRADGNIHDKIQVEVVDKELKIYTLGDIRQERVLDVYVNYTSLSAIHASGASGLKSRGILKADNLKVIASVASELMLQIDADSLDLEMNGAANVQLAGKVNYFELLLTHVGDLMAYNLVSQEGKIRIDTGEQSPGYARIHVEQSLDVHIKGPRHLKYKGNPMIKHEKIEGKGKLMRY